MDVCNTFFVPNPALCPTMTIRLQLPMMHIRIYYKSLPQTPPSLAIKYSQEPSKELHATNNGASVEPNGQSVDAVRTLNGVDNLRTDNQTHSGCTIDRAVLFAGTSTCIVIHLIKGVERIGLIWRT
jgi:hypothetical protein